MTESEWLTATDPTSMLKHLGKTASVRKLRLFACACCRRVWDFVRDERLQSAFDIVESCADKEASDKKRLEARRGITSFRMEHYDGHREEEICIGTELWNASAKARSRSIETWGNGAATAFAWARVSDYSNRLVAERAAQVALVRDIFGNPFRPVKFPKKWRTEHAVGLAAKMYDEREFAAMPILADALEEAGCDNADIQSHCREPGVHVRGCWVVDLVLGKG